MDYHSIIPPVAAILLALLTYWFVNGLGISVQRSAAARLEAHAKRDPRNMTDRVGDLLVDRLGLRLKAWEHELRWAQIGGYYMTAEEKPKPKSVGSVLGQSVLFAGLGLAYVLAFRAFSPIYLIIIALAAYYPYMTLRGRADTVREAVKRGLPEAAALVAAEMSAGNSITLGMERASELPGPIGKILRSAMERATASGALLFSQAEAKGMLPDYITELQFSPLEAFTARMDAVAERGAEGPQRMTELARDLAMEYQVAVARAAETLDTKLLMPMTLFFFVPFMLAIFLPLAVSMFSAF
ncbi:MAG: hypothetical protein WCE68_00380 [Anaerolineales bacterium]